MDDTKSGSLDQPPELPEIEDTEWDDTPPLERLWFFALGIGAVAFTILDLFVLTLALTLHSDLEGLMTRSMAALTSAQSVAPGAGVAPGGPQVEPPTVTPSEPTEEEEEDEPSNLLERCLESSTQEPPPTGDETIQEAVSKTWRGAISTLRPALCVAAFNTLINTCFWIASILLILAVVLAALSWLLSWAEKKCKRRRRKKKKKWWQKLISWVVKILCWLATVMKWVTLILAILSVIAAVVLFVYCVIQLLTL